MSDDKVVIRVKKATFDEVIKPYAESRECEYVEALERLLRVGHSRTKALDNYAQYVKDYRAKTAKESNGAKKKRASKPKAEKKAAAKKPKAKKPKKDKPAPLAVAAGEHAAPAPVALESSPSAPLPEPEPAPESASGFDPFDDI